jgi:hypothetical protein
MAAAAVPHMAANDDNLLVLSYNICWGCMQNDTKDGTGFEVAKECAKKPDTCMQNVTNTIDHISIDNGIPYDLVGLQEASRYSDIHSNSSTLAPMIRVHALYNQEHIVSFYNPNKFSLLAFAGIDIALLIGKGSGRPMLILVLERKTDKEKILFINFHNGHGYEIKNLHDAVSVALTRFGNLVDPTISQNLDNIQREDLSKFKRKGNLTQLNFNFSEYNIIVTADSNENTSAVGGKFCRGQFQPLFNLGIQTPVSTTTTPITCCITIVNREGGLKLIGDYILYSNKIRAITDNKVPDFANYKPPNFSYTVRPRSDHLPVYSILLLPSIVHSMSSMSLEMPKYILNQGISSTYKRFKLNNYQKEEIFKQISDDRSELIIPNGKPVYSRDNGTSMVLVMDAANFMNVGYIQTIYITNDASGTPKLNQKSKTLRLLNLSSDPNSPKSKDFTGPTISDTTPLIYPTGQKFRDGNGTEYICLVEERNPDNFGLIRTERIKQIMTGGIRKIKLNTRNKKTNKKTRKNKKDNKLFSKKK